MLILAVLAPIFLTETFLYHERCERLRNEEIQANAEIAGSVSNTFSQFIEHILQHELLTGIALIRQDLSITQYNHFLRNDRSAHALSYVHWIDPRGRIAASSEPGMVGADRSDRSYYKEIAAGQPWFLSELYLSRVTGKPIFAIARAMPDEQGKLLGIVVAGVDPENLGNVLAFKRTPGGALEIIDRNGMAVYRCPKVDCTWEKRNLLKEWPFLANILSRHETMSFERNGLDGKERIYATTPVSSTGWVVAASRTEKEALEPITDSLIHEAGLFLLVMAGSLIGAFLLSKAIVVPIENLQEQVKAFAGGEKPDGPKIAGCIELSELARSFKAMAGEIQLREESLDRLRREKEAILTSAGEGILGLDSDGKIKFINPASAKMLGYEIGELIGRTSHSLIHHTKADGSPCPEGECLINRTYRDNAPHELTEDVFWKKNGQMFPVEYTSTPIKEDGKTTGAVITFRDITARKQAQDALRKSEARYRAIVQDQTELICRFKPGGAVSFVNDACCRYFGKSYEEIVGRSFMPFIPEEDRDLLEKGLSSLAPDNPVVTIEHRVIAADGKIRWQQWTNRALFDEIGQISEVQAVGRDITEQKQAEEALRESEEKYSTLVNRAGDGVYIVQDEIFKFVNQAFADVHGYTVQEIEGRSIYDLIAPESRDKIKDKYRRRLEGEVIPTYETTILCKDGTVKTAELSGALIQYQGKPTTMGIMRDVTERKKTEQELLRMDKIESVGLLAGGIAHDFNNLLVGILGSLSLVKMDADINKRSLEMLNSTEKAALQAKRLAGQLLTLSHGGTPIKKTEDISKFLCDTVSLPLRGTNVECKCAITDDLWPAVIDEGQFNQAISNLVTNAQQSMPNGGAISITAGNLILNEDHPPLKAGRYVQITIEDRGIGIPEGHLERIFDPYFTTKQKGRGLGLTIVHSIIQKHDGHIEVESKLGAGTTFRIYLPAAQGKAETVQQSIEKKGAIQAEGSRILLLEDQEIVRNVAEKMLEVVGCEVEFSRNAREAVEKYKDAKESGKPFDAVILDLTIPGGMGGQEAMKELQKVDPEVKGIVSSGYSDDPVMSHYRDYGFQGAIAKPYDIEEMKKTLRDVMAA